MFLELFLAFINGLFTLSRKFLKVPGFDINGIALVIIILEQGNTLLGIPLLLLSHAFTNLSNTRYLVLALPAMIVTLFTSTFTSSLLILYFTYHATIFIISIPHFSSRYIMFLVTNTAIALVIVRIYFFFI